MKRYLLAQMRHEWKSNIWLIIELAVVLAAIWIMMVNVIYFISALWQPRGFDDNDVYTLSISYISPESPEYVDMGEATDEYNFRDQKQLIDRLRANPYVEAAAFSDNCTPYSMSYMGNEVWVVGENDSIEMENEEGRFKFAARYSCNWRRASPDVARVLRLNSLTGKSAADIEKMLRDGHILLSPNPSYDRYRDSFDLLGKKVSRDSVNEYKVADMIESVRRTGYEMAWAGTLIEPIDESLQSGSRYPEILVRVKPGMGDKFAEQLYADKSLRQQRNVILSSLTNLKDKGEVTERSKASELRSTVGVIVIFLIMVFLGLLGSFWYRVQQRQPEIAMRKVCGADNRDIFTRLFSEGSLLLAVAVLVDAALAVGLIIWGNRDKISIPGIMTGDQLLILCGVVSAVLMLMMIVLGILFPARRACKVEPAIALKDE